MEKIIRDRIEKIEKDIVPEGYKKTSIGIIPQDWQVKKLGEVAEVFSGGTPKTTVRSYYNGDIPWINSSDLKNKYIYSVNGKISELGYENSSAKFIEKDTLLYALYGATAGKTSISKIKATINQAILAIECTKINMFFLYFNLNLYKDNLVHVFTQGGQPNFSGQVVKSFNIPIPPFEEQEKIADILTLWDEYIENMDNLIEKKEELKKGLMQKLLTGEKRLPGHTQPWKKVKLGDILDYEQPNKYIVSDFRAENSCDFNVPVLTANKAFILGYTDEKENIYDNLPVIIFDDFTTDIKYVNFIFKIRSSAIKILKNKENFDLKFIYEKMKLINYPTDNHKRYYISEYRHIKLNLPPLDEQKAIGDILSKADEEIELLKELRDKKLEEKKGLMQLLLTGIIRV